MERVNEYRSIKRGQVDQYDRKAAQFRTRGHGLLLLIILGFAWVVLGLLSAAVFIETFYDSLIGLILFVLSFPAVLLAEIPLCRLRRDAVKSAILLEQLAFALRGVLDDPRPEEDQLKHRISEIETKFLANDDELFTKKFIWGPYMQFMSDKIDAATTWGSSGVWIQRIDLPPVWLEGDALKTDYRDRSIVHSDWKIRLKFRELWFVWNDFRKFEILSDLDLLAQVNVIVFERFLRSKKTSKYLKSFKQMTRVFYLSPAGKMRLVAFVNSVISERPYKAGSTETEELLADKNEQIRQYTTDFWKVHRRSLRFYFFEAIWLVWLVPFLGFSAYLWYHSHVTLAAVVFFLGAALVVYGEMIMIRRQMIDLKGKKLMPPLIASLIGIRHAMCENAGEADTADKYRKYFKNAEKHFMLTTKEIESVQYVQENLKDKVKQTVSADTSDLCKKKKEQLASYYKEFNFYRRQCMKFGCLEAFIALMVIPVYAFAFWLSHTLGFDAIDEVVNMGYWGLGIVTEIILIRRHIFAWRYKELYLLLYQELAATLADPDMMDDHEKLMRTFQRTERDAVEAAKLDGMDDAVEFICGVSGLAKPRSIH